MGVRHQPREMMKAPGSEDRGSLYSSVWWAMPGLNRRPLPCQGSALPLRQPPEVETGFEPVYTDLQSVASPLGHSTWMELLAPQAGWESLVLRADDEIRTRDPHLGKVMLYQLSHVRIALLVLALSDRLVRRVENSSAPFPGMQNRPSPARFHAQTQPRRPRCPTMPARASPAHPDRRPGNPDLQGGA